MLPMNAGLPPWLEQTLAILLALLPGALWCVFWLCAADWTKMWPVLKRGAWLPLVLLMLMVALVWSELAPHDFSLGGMGRVPNFWYQLVLVSGLVAMALFSGWLQGIWHCRPGEIAFEPPGSGATGSHGHGEHAH